MRDGVGRVTLRQQRHTQHAVRPRQVRIQLQSFAQRRNRLAVIFLFVINGAQIHVSRRQARRELHDALELAHGGIQISGALGVEPGVDMPLQLGRGLQCYQQRHEGDHSVSLTVTIRSTAIFSSTCFFPPGHMISTVASFSDPMPKCTRPSPAER